MIRAACAIACLCLLPALVRGGPVYQHLTAHLEPPAGPIEARGGQPGVVVLPPVEPGLAFNEALLSFNADVPEDATIALEMRVRGEDGAWSPWLFVVDWTGPGGSPTPGPLVTRADTGRIDVDFFTSRTRHDAAQVRATATSTGPARSVALHDVTLTFSDTLTPPPEAPAPGRASAAQHRLDVPFRSQYTEDPTIAGRICSPTSVAMVLEYHGIATPTQTAADTIYDARHDLFGNWPRAVQGAYSLGAPGYLTRFGDWEAVARTLEQGTPIIASIRVREGQLRNAPYPSTGGHLIVITGLDGKGHALVNDCAVGDPQRGRVLYHLEDLETVWLRGSAGTSYILLPPGSAPGGRS